MDDLEILRNIKLILRAVSVPNSFLIKQIYYKFDQITGQQLCESLCAPENKLQLSFTVT